MEQFAVASLPGRHHRIQACRRTRRRKMYTVVGTTTSRRGPNPDTVGSRRRSLNRSSNTLYSPTDVGHRSPVGPPKNRFVVKMGLIRRSKDLDLPSTRLGGIRKRHTRDLPFLKRDLVLVIHRRVGQPPRETISPRLPHRARPRGRVATGAAKTTPEPGGR